MSERLDLALALDVDAYIEGLFVPPDGHLAQALDDARKAGLPAINVSANEGKLLHLIARIAGARRILEVGTLGGYSTAWLARAVPTDGHVVTLEIDPRHAEVARKNLARCGLGERVEIREGPAATTLRRMIADGEAPFDLVFIDADKPAYCEYLELTLQLARPGTVILADNLIRDGQVLEDAPRDENARAAKAFNRAIATHPRLDSLVLPIIREKLDGLSISVVR
jgi:caffeoyl-CoA O-methyltransferase